MRIYSEFKEFIQRGNVVDLAVAVVLGLAFGKVVTSFVDDVLMPPIGLLLGGTDFSNLFASMNGASYPSLAATRAAGAATIHYGLFLNAVIQFLIIAFAIFLVVKALNALWHRQAAKIDCPFCDTPISAEAMRCPNCTTSLKAAPAITMAPELRATSRSGHPGDGVSGPLAGTEDGLRVARFDARYGPGQQAAPRGCHSWHPNRLHRGPTSDPRGERPNSSGWANRRIRSSSRRASRPRPAAVGPAGGSRPWKGGSAWQDILS